MLAVVKQHERAIRREPLDHRLERAPPRRRPHPDCVGQRWSDQLTIGQRRELDEPSTVRRALEVLGGVTCVVLGRRDADDDDLATALAQQPRDDETVAAVVALAAEHRHWTVGHATRELAREWTGDGVSVVAIAIGRVATESLRKYPVELWKTAAASVPLGRLGAYVLPGAAHDPVSGIEQARATERMLESVVTPSNETSPALFGLLT